MTPFHDGTQPLRRPRERRCNEPFACPRQQGGGQAPRGGGGWMSRCVTAPLFCGAVKWPNGIAVLGHRWCLCGMVRGESIGCRRKSAAPRIVNRRTSAASASAAICGSCRASWLDCGPRRDLERRRGGNGNLTVAVATGLGNRCIRNLCATRDATTLAAVKARSVANQELPVRWGNAVRLPTPCRLGPDAGDFA
jgi:hypothetical protein